MPTAQTSSTVNLTEYAQSAPALTVGFLARQLGDFGRGARITAAAQGAWVESFTVEVTRGLEVRWKWETLPGNALSGDDHIRVRSEVAWEEQAQEMARRLREGNVASHALHARANESDFRTSLQNARLYEPTQRLVYHFRCAGCSGLKVIPCRACSGAGSNPCPYCGGRPEGRTVRLDGGAVRASCARCKGSGRADCGGCRGNGAQPCSACAATGQMSRVTRFFVSATEERSIAAEDASGALLQAIIRDVLDDESRTGLLRQEGPPGEQASRGSHCQQFTFSLPVCRVRTSFHEHKGTVFVVGYRPEVFFARTVLDPVVSDLLLCLQTATQRPKWFPRELLAARHAQANARSSALLGRLGDMMTGPTSVRLGVKVDSAGQTVEGVDAITRELSHALSPEKVVACVRALHESQRLTRRSARAFATCSGLAAATLAGCVIHMHIGTIPAAAPAFITSACALLYAAIL